MPCCPDSADVAADVSPAAAVVVDYLHRCGRSSGLPASLWSVQWTTCAPVVGPVDCLCRCGRSSDSLTDRLIDVQFPGIQPVAERSRVCPALQRTGQFGRSYVVTVWSLLRGHSLVAPTWSVWSLLRGRSWVTPMVTVQCAVYDCRHTPREGADDIADLTTIRPV